MNNHGRVLVAMIALGAACASQAQSNKELDRYFNDSLGSEGFEAIPYGADSRFQPKAIWIYLDDFQASANKPKRQKAWIILSNGSSILTETLVPLQNHPVTMRTRGLDAKTKLAVAASLSGSLNGIGIEEGIELAREKGVDLDIDLGTTEVVYVDLFDVLMAQKANSLALERMNETIRESYGKDVPLRRVITAALRSRGATISVRNTSNINFSSETTLTEFLAKLGLNFDKDRNNFDKLTFDDWRYVAYQSRYTDKDGKIGTAAATDPIRITAENLAPFTENSFGSAGMGQ